MSKESFSWRSLFINEDKNETPNPQVPPTTGSSETTKFPETMGGSTTGSATNPYLPEILDVYEKGFDSLNIPEFDFYELYKSVMAVGIANPQSYQMAFAMGKSLRPDLTKSFLLEKAKYYIDEIEKVHTKYDATGQGKRKELTDSVAREKDELAKKVDELERKIVELQRELELKTVELDSIDSKNRAQFNELQLKIEANNLAKAKILDSINHVVIGINQYL